MLMPDITKANAMRHLFSEEGRTIASIGKAFSVSRQRAAQILKRHFPELNQSENLNRRNQWRAEKKRARWLLNKERHSNKIQGCSYTELQQIETILGKKAFLAFSAQRRNSQIRNISWEFSFKEWADLWIESGHWAERGRKKGNFVMGRHGDVGPYCRKNCKIITIVENSHEWQEIKALKRAK